MKLLSIVVPCYNEELSIPYFYDALSDVGCTLLKNQIELEIIFVDDGSTDDTLAIIKKYMKQDSRIKYVSFSRNFGKEAAMFAGLENSAGDYVAIMDADLQDPPSLLPEMLEILEHEDYDMVATRRVNRVGEPRIRSFFAHHFYKLINRFIDFEIVDGARDYRLMKRTAVNAILSVREYNRFSKGIFGWIGFKTKWLEYENQKRVAGETKWSFIKLLRYSIEGITAYTTLPLTISLWIGMIMCIISVVGAVYVAVGTLISGQSGQGWASLVCIILFLGGVQLFGLGIVGEYLSKTYLESKRRPIYIIRESNILPPENKN
ncbi:MAG: glycosyltransferase family 2 protein [Clostridiales bacterium]|nr:glycosyltransferase family 2 protein [Clostridiales bacterium]